MNNIPRPRPPSGHEAWANPTPPPPALRGDVSRKIFLNSMPPAGDTLSQRVSQAVSPQQRMRIEVEWHAASLSVVHRILSPRTGEQIQQLPVAQVLDLVDDVMKQIQKG